MTRGHRIALLLLALGTVAKAQLPSAPPVTRLRQMEGIYQKELSSRHIPLLGKYLVDLQRLTVSTSAKAAYQAEIARIQQIITSGGVVDLVAAQQTQAGTPMPMPMPAPTPIERKNALIVLTSSLAQDVSPTPAANAAAALVSEATWRIELISAGTYDLLLQYACTDLAQPLKISVEFNGQTVEKTMEADRVTQDAETFRILRLGSLTLTGDHRGETLRFTVGDKNAPKLILKSLLITQPRPAN